MNRPLFAHDRATLYADRAAWEAARTPAGEHRIGASIVGTILTDPWAALETLTGQAPEPDRATRLAWARGHIYEAAIIEHYALLTERVALPIGPAMGGAPGSLVIIRHRTEPWLAVSPDGATVDPELGAGGVEAKDYVGGEWADVDCVVRSVADYHPGIAPAGLYTQCLVQCEATGWEFVELVRRMPRGDLRVIRVMRDEATQREIVDTVGEFREKHLLRGEPLDVDGSEACKRLLTKRFPGVGKDLRDATSEEARKVLRYAKAKRLIEKIEKLADTLRNEIAEALGDTYGLALGGKAKALLIPTKGRRTVALGDVETKAPELYARLVEGGFVSTGEPYRQLRTYGC